MRYQEFTLSEDRAREIIAQKYPHYTEEQINEAIPAMLGALAGGAAKLGAKAAVGAAKVAGKVGAKMGKAAVKGAASMAKNAVKGAGQKLAQKAAGKVQDKATGQMAKAMLKPGVKLPIPDATGKEQEFEIDSVKGKEVTLKNPQGSKPGEPLKTVHDKKDLDPIIAKMAGQV